MRVSIAFDTGAITKVYEWTLESLYPGAGITNIQGITRRSDNSIYFTDAANKKIRNFSLDLSTNTVTVLPATEITVGFLPNGLAYIPSLDALWILSDPNDASFPNTLEKWPCNGGARISTNANFAPGLTNKDHLFVVPDGEALCVSYGSNGTDGGIAIFDKDAVNQMGAYVLPAVRAVEGFVIVGNKLYIVSDEFYHVTAAGTANKLHLYYITPPSSNVVDIFGVFDIPATTGVDCIFSVGEPVGGVGGGGIGVFPASTSELRVYANTSTGTGQQALLAVTGLTLSNVNVFYARLDSVADVLTMWINGVQVGTVAAAMLSSSLKIAQNLRLGQTDATDGSGRFANWRMKEFGAYAGAGDRAKTEAYLTALAA